MEETLVQDLIERGYVIVEQAFSPAFLEQVTAYAKSQPGAPVVAGPLKSGELLENPQLGGILHKVLGDAYILGRLALCEHARRLPLEPLRAPLYGDSQFEGIVPTVGLVVHAFAASTSVRVEPDSHRRREHDEKREAATLVHVPAGAAFVHDMRLEAAVSDASNHHTLVALFYRRWFREPAGLQIGEPLVIAPWTYVSLPKSQRPLFSWRFERYSIKPSRQHAVRVVSKLAEPAVRALHNLYKRR